MQVFLHDRAGGVHVDAVNVSEPIHQADHQQNQVGGREDAAEQRRLFGSGRGVRRGHGRKLYQEAGRGATVFFLGNKKAAAGSCGLSPSRRTVLHPALAVTRVEGSASARLGSGMARRNRMMKAATKAMAAAP